MAKFHEPTEISLLHMSQIMEKIKNAFVTGHTAPSRVKKANRKATNKSKPNRTTNTNRTSYSHDSQPTSDESDSDQQKGLSI